jgi:hypothetical protein
VLLLAQPLWQPCDTNSSIELQVELKEGNSVIRIAGKSNINRSAQNSNTKHNNMVHAMPLYRRNIMRIGVCRLTACIRNKFHVRWHRTIAVIALSTHWSWHSTNHPALMTRCSCWQMQLAAAGRCSWQQWQLLADAAGSSGSCRHSLADPSRSLTPTPSKTTEIQHVLVICTGMPHHAQAHNKPQTSSKKMVVAIQPGKHEALYYKKIATKQVTKSQTIHTTHCTLNH